MGRDLRCSQWPRHEPDSAAIRAARPYLYGWDLNALHKTCAQTGWRLAGQGYAFRPSRSFASFIEKIWKTPALASLHGQKWLENRASY